MAADPPAVRNVRCVQFVDSVPIIAERTLSFADTRILRELKTIRKSREGVETFAFAELRRPRHDILGRLECRFVLRTCDRRF